MQRGQSHCDGGVKVALGGGFAAFHRNQRESTQKVIESRDFTRRVESSIESDFERCRKRIH